MKARFKVTTVWRRVRWYYVVCVLIVIGTNAQIALLQFNQKKSVALPGLKFQLGFVLFFALVLTSITLLVAKRVREEGISPEGSKENA